MTAPGHDLPGKVAQLKAVIDAARALVADWKAKRSTHGNGLAAAVDALDADVADNASPWLAWALGGIASEALGEAETRGYLSAIGALRDEVERMMQSRGRDALAGLIDNYSKAATFLETLAAEAATAPTGGGAA